MNLEKMKNMGFDILEICKGGVINCRHPTVKDIDICKVYFLFSEMCRKRIEYVEKDDDYSYFMVYIHDNDTRINKFIPVLLENSDKINILGSLKIIQFLLSCLNYNVKLSFSLDDCPYLFRLKFELDDNEFWIDLLSTRCPYFKLTYKFDKAFMTESIHYEEYKTLYDRIKYALKGLDKFETNSKEYLIKKIKYNQDYHKDLDIPEDIFYEIKKYIDEDSTILFDMNYGYWLTIEDYFKSYGDGIKRMRVYG